MSVIDTLVALAITVRNEKKKEANSAIRIGDLFLAIIDFIKGLTTGQIRQEGVDTYNDTSGGKTSLLNKYSSPQLGWTVLVRNDETNGGKASLYQWNGSKWINLETVVYNDDVAISGGSDKTLFEVDLGSKPSVDAYLSTSNYTGVLSTQISDDLINIYDAIPYLRLSIKKDDLMYMPDGKTKRRYIISVIGFNQDSNKYRLAILGESDTGSFAVSQSKVVIDTGYIDVLPKNITLDNDNYSFYCENNISKWDFWLGYVGVDNLIPADLTTINTSFVNPSFLNRKLYNDVQGFFLGSHKPVKKESNFHPLASGVIGAFDLNKAITITIKSNNPFNNKGDVQDFFVSALGKNPSNNQYRIVILGKGESGSYNRVGETPSGDAFVMYDSGYSSDPIPNLDNLKVVANGRVHYLSIVFDWDYAQNYWIGGAIGENTKRAINTTIDVNGKYQKTCYVNDSDTVDPRDYGAIYDGITDCAPAINMALLTGKKIKLIGNGIALCKDSLIISKDGTSIDLDNSFTIKLANQTNKPLIVTIGAQYKYDDPLVYTKVVRNVSIRGGILDFNGANQTRDFVDKTYVGFGMQIADASNFKFADCIIRNPNSFGFQGGGLHGFDIRNIICEYDNLRPNMDGIHINGDSLDGMIENITGTTNDDMVALNAVDGEEYMLRKGDIRRVTIRDVKCYSNGFRGIRLLNDNTQMFDEINIDGVFGEYRYDGVLVSSYRGVPAKIGRINISNILCYSLNSALVYIQNGGAICEVESLNISKLNYKQRFGRIIPLIKLEGKIGTLSINDVTLQTDDINLSGLSLINGVGSIDNVILNNLIIDAPITQPRTKDLMKTKFKSLLVNNSIVHTTNMYNLQSNGSHIKEGNILFDGINKIVDNGYSYVLE